MRKTMLKFMLGISCIGLSACGNGAKAESNTVKDSVPGTEQAVEIVESASVEEPQANFEKMKVTAKMIFALVLPQGQSSDGFEDVVISECTPSFIEALKQMNDFDDGGIAWWALRTMEQEGPETESSVISISPDGENAVVVEYSDMGYKANTRLEFIKVDDCYKVNSASVTYNNETRTIK